MFRRTANEWDWGRMPKHPTTNRYESSPGTTYRPPTSANRPGGASAYNAPQTPFQQQQAAARQQNDMRQRMELERKRQEKMLLAQQNQFTQNRDRMLSQITDPIARRKFLYQQWQAEREFRMERAAMDNPTLKSVYQKMQQQPGMFQGVPKQNMSGFLFSWMAQISRPKARMLGAIDLPSAKSYPAIQQGGSYDESSLTEPQRIVLKMFDSYSENFLNSATDRYNELINRVLILNHYDPEEVSQETIESLLKDYNLPSSAEEFAAQMMATSGASNISQWVVGRNTFSDKTGQEGMTLFLGLLGRDISAGPLELRQYEFVRLMTGPRPGSGEASSTEWKFINPIAFTVPPYWNDDLSASMEFMTYVSAPSIIDQALKTGRLVDDPQLLADLMAARHLAFLLMYVEEEINGTLPDFYKGDPNAYVLRQVPNGYGGNTIYDPNEDEPTRQGFINQTQGYLFYLSYARDIFGVTDEPIPPFVDDFVES